MSIPRPLRNLSELSLFIRILFFAMSVPLLLRLRLSALQLVLEPKNPPSTFDPAQIQTISACVDDVVSVGIKRGVIRSTCLTRGTTLYYFLRRAGLDVSLCFGIGNVDGKFVGHCWLVKDEQPYLERTDPRSLFTEIHRIPHRTPIHGNSESTNPRLTISA
jgi:hypothetical protein